MQDGSHVAEGKARSIPAAGTAGGPVRRGQIWGFFGPAFVASVAYIDPGNFATNIVAGSQFGYRLLWVLLASNLMAILIQYLSAKLGIVTGRTLPENCREQFSRPVVVLLWVCGEISAVATDLAEFLGAALGLDLLIGPALLAHGLSATGALFCSAMVATVAVVAILALELAGFRWLERGIMVFVGLIGLCYGFEMFLVHPDWHAALVSSVLPRFDGRALGASVYAAIGMLGATVMPHVIYLHSSLVLPRTGETREEATLRRYLRFELIDVLAAMNGAWLINSAMVVMAAVALARGVQATPSIQDAFQTLGPLLGRGAAVVFAVALLCSGLSSSTVGIMAGQVIIEGFLKIRFPVFVRRFVTVLPALAVIGAGWDPLKILVGSQVMLSFTLPAALIPLLLLTGRAEVMREFRSSSMLALTGWVITALIVALDGFGLWQTIAG